MMINTDDKQIAEAVAFLEKLGISEHDCALAERYLNKAVGDEVLDQFQRIDFTALNISYRMIQEELSVIKWRMTQEGNKLWSRLFNVLFAIGHSTSSVLFNSRCVDGEQCKSLVIYIEKCSK